MLIAVIALLCDIPVGTNNDILLLEKLNGNICIYFLYLTKILFKNY